MSNSKKELAKIYYQDREVKYINITFSQEYHSNESRSIYIGASTHISGKEEVISINYNINEYDDDKDKEYDILDWQIRNNLDTVQVKHDSSGINIEWLSAKDDVKSSLFVPMARIDHITVDNPESNHDDEIPKGVIDK